MRVDDSIYLVGASLLLVLLNAIFVASEFSLLKIRYSHFNPDLLDDLRKGKRFAGLLNGVDRSFRLLRLGTAISTLMLGAVFVPITKLMADSFGISTEGLGGVILAMSSFLAAIGIHSVLGDLFPRGIALQHPLETLNITSWVILPFQWVLSPILRPLDLISKFLLRLLRLDPTVSLNRLDLEAQLTSLNEESDIPVFTQQVFKNVISMRELVVQDVMLPRNQIQYFDIFDGNEVNVEMCIESGHTRFPLCEGDLDNCIGIMHIKDIFRAKEEIHGLNFKKLARPVVYVTLDDQLESVLEKLLEARLHMALVRDDFGGTVGLITIENIMEELVGNIQDEFDSEAEQIEEIHEDVFIIDGLTPIHDVEEKLNVQFDEDDVSTIGGLITSKMGRIPEVGQTVRIGNIELEAVEVDEKRVLSARVRVVLEDV
ncbi:MAG: hemolysin family protein [Verrucomicrobia bacterium]|nr:hemolysin family protein [Verrucomicrobiota bacterium]